MCTATFQFDCVPPVVNVAVASVLDIYLAMLYPLSGAGC